MSSNRGVPLLLDIELLIVLINNSLFFFLVQENYQKIQITTHLCYHTSLHTSLLMEAPQPMTAVELYYATSALCPVADPHPHMITLQRHISCGEGHG